MAHYIKFKKIYNFIEYLFENIKIYYIIYVENKKKKKLWKELFYIVI